jgi:hypothetical protein
MARKKKSSPLEDMMDLVALLPWWGGVAIAVVGYLVLHRMAAPVKVGAVQPGQVSQLMTASIITGLATIGQYLVPLVGLAGAAMSFMGCHGANLKCWWVRRTPCKATESPKLVVAVRMVALIWC